MIHKPGTNKETDPLKRALAAVREANARLKAHDRGQKEPLAIIGIGARFPGSSNSPQAYWRLLQNRIDGIASVPRDRWDPDRFYGEDSDTPAGMRFREAGFIDGTDLFDPYFFGISPREAANMDPQQRLFLQVAWEALENAGIPAEHLRDTETGVFVGANNYDYFHLQMMNPDVLDTYTVVGSANSIIANRLSYFLDLRGPSLVVDTACSSSLTAVHLACQSLRSGESEMAIAGGLNVILSPFSAMAHAKGFPMAADARCRTFDARANGYVRGEGCGVILLKRLGDAIRDGDGIWATIRGSAINQDGKTNGLMAPNGLSQQKVMRKALKNAGMEASQVSLVEAHGTATELGDPIEAEAIQEIYGPGRSPDRPCYLGSVKTNIGHLEGAAGIAGLIKVALSLYHRTIPPNLHFHELNPLIALDESIFKVPVRSHEWPASEPRCGAVSAFGAGGSNAHVLLEEAPAATITEPGAKPGSRAQLLLLSAKTPRALHDLAERWRHYLDREAAVGQIPLYDLAFNAATRRSHFDFRLAVAGATVQDWSRRLKDWLSETGAGEPGTVSVNPRKILFLFPGQGSQWPGMGRALLEQEPVFRDAVSRCDHAARPFIEWSLTEQLRAGPETSRLDEIDVAQPCLWAISVALAALWRSWGIEPDLVAGISMGEVAAATVSGSLSHEDGARVICLRSKLLKERSPEGAMAMVALSRDQTEETIKGLGASLSVAIAYSARSTVISGTPKEIEKALSVLSKKNVFCKVIAVTVPSHGPLMEPLCLRLPDLLKGLSPLKPAIPLFSTVTGALVEDMPLNAAYWSRNLREPVLFSDHMNALLSGDDYHFVEISPNPLLLAPLRQNLEAAGREAITVAGIGKDADPRSALLESWGALYRATAAIDPLPLFPEPAPRLRLPTYAWQNEPFWFQDRARTYTRQTAAGREPEPESDPPPSCLYRLVWREAAPLAGRSLPRALAGEHILVVTDHGFERDLCDALEELGYRVRSVRPEQSRDIPQILRDIETEGPLRAVVYMPGLGDTAAEREPEIAAYASPAVETLRWAQALNRAIKTKPSAKLKVVTSGAQSLGQGPAPNLHHVPVWGLGRVLALEFPSIWDGLIDLAHDVHGLEGRAFALRLCRELLAGDGEDQILIGKRGRWAARVERLEPKRISKTGTTCRGEASYLLTGPDNPWTLCLARFLADKGARRLLLLDTADPSACESEFKETWQTLPNDETTVEWLPPEPERLTDRLALLEEEGFPVKGVICTGTALSVMNAETMSEAFLLDNFRREAWLPWMLHSILGECPLDFFVMFSSAASVWGSTGIAHHGASHHFLDSLAHFRRAGEMPALSINWVPWSGCGMVPLENEKASAAMGVFPWQPEAALGVLDLLLASDSVQATAAEIDWRLLKPVYEAKHPRPVLERVGNDAGFDKPENHASTFLNGLVNCSDTEARDRIAALVAETLATVLGFSSPAALNREQGFFQLGMDSIMAVELRRRLERDIGKKLPLTLAFEYPTLASLTIHVTETLLGPKSTEKDEKAEPTGDWAALAKETESLTEPELMAMIANELEDGGSEP